MPNNETVDMLRICCAAKPGMALEHFDSWAKTARAMLTELEAG